MHTQEIVGYKLSPQQKHIWQINAKDEDFACLFQCELKIHGPLDQEKLRLAVRAAVLRHEILRTGFVHLPGMNVPLQVVENEPQFEWTVCNLNYLDEKEAAHARSNAIEVASQRTIDYEKGPMLEAWLLKESGDEQTLLLTLPAMCADRVSMLNLAGDISRFYASDNPDLPQEPMQYADLAHWLNELLESEEPSPGKQYWKKYLKSGAETHTERKAAELPHRAECVEIEWTESCSRELAGFAHDAGVSEQSVLLACWQVLLGRMSRTEQVKVMLCLPGRSYEGTEGAIGPLERFAPFVTEIGQTQAFRDLLRQVENALKESHEWQEYYSPETERRAVESRQEYAFSYEEQPLDWTIGGLKWRILGNAGCAERTKGNLRCIRQGNALKAGLSFDSAALSHSAARRLLQQFSTLVQRAIATQQDTLVEELDLVSPEEQRYLLEHFNATAADYDLDRTVLSIFEQQCKRAPGSVALISGDDEVTYSVLNQRADELASRLRAHGAQQEQVIGVCLDRGTNLIISLLAIWKSGAAYLPLDIDHPEERTAYLLKSSKVQLIVTQREHAGKLQAHSCALIVVDSDQLDATPVTQNNLPVEIASRNLAYVIYTSGSTGEPKGVMVEHRSLLNHMLWVIGSFGLGERERVLFKTNISFDASIWEWLFPLMQGGTLVIAEKGMQSDSRYLVQQLRQHRITTLQVVPTMLRVLVEEEGFSSCDDLQRVFAGGEALPSELVERYKARTGKELINLYGPTEATIDATGCVMSPGQNGVIGRPVANTQVFVMNRHLRLTAIGEPGELCIAGAALARGYFSRPAETALKYVPNPHGSGELLYRTGDQARWREDGVLEFLGRVDDQVKVRGYRIELGEVERAIAGQEKVEQAAVVVKERVGGERQLVAYVELESGSGGEEMARVRAGVRERLPEYMCPGVYVKLEKLPRSSSGKIDRRALAEMEWVEEGEGGYVGPGNEVEERLAGIWAGVLGRKRVGVRENFFELGGDSIVGIQIVARARQMGIEVTPKQLFQHQTIAELAAVAEVAEAWGGGRRGEEAEQGEVKGEAPLTPIQRWFFQQETDNVNYCNQAFLFVVGEEIRGEWVEEGLKKLVEQHDQLRARFKREGGEWKQWYAGTGESVVEVRRIDLSGEKAEEREARLRAVIEEEQRGLDIERGPLLRAAWIELGQERGRRLLVVVHHLGVDGVSWRIMLEDMESWYRQRAEGREGSLGLKTTSYKRWGEELERYGKSEELEREREYWEREEGREVEALPVDWGEGRNLAGDEKRVQRVLGEKATRELLGEAGRAYHTQVMELLVSALAGGLQRWRGQKRVRVEMEGHGREEFVKGVDVTRTVGWFTSVYPVVVEWREGEGTGERVKRVKEEMRRIPQKGMGYGVLQYVGEGIRKNKESELLVNYLGQMDGSMGEGAMLRAAPEGSGRSVSEGMQRSSKVELNAVVLGGQLHMIWGYSGKQYREETIVELAEAYEQSLLEVIEHCLSPEAGGFTPADFTEAGLEQHELEYLLEKIDQIG